jgi:hypothetical protein
MDISRAVRAIPHPVTAEEIQAQTREWDAMAATEHMQMLNRVRHRPQPVEREEEE